MAPCQETWGEEEIREKGRNEACRDSLTATHQEVTSARIDRVTAQRTIHGLPCPTQNNPPDFPVEDRNLTARFSGRQAEEVRGQAAIMNVSPSSNEGWVVAIESQIAV